MKTPFEYHQLPVSDLQRLGLVSGGHIELEPSNISALLMGRRTGLITVRNLEANGLMIEKIDLKLSLHQNTDGRISLGLHPIFRHPQTHRLLEGYDADPLLDGSVRNIHKVYNNGADRALEAVIEYDAQTRTFIAYDPSQVLAPIAINGITLTEQQEQDFRLGHIVDLGDGTKFQHRATEPLGILANRRELLLSFGEGTSTEHLYIHGIGNIPELRQSQLNSDTPSFRRAMQENQTADFVARTIGEDLWTQERETKPGR